MTDDILIHADSVEEQTGNRPPPVAVHILNEVQTVSEDRYMGIATSELQLQSGVQVGYSKCCRLLVTSFERW